MRNWYPTVTLESESPIGNLSVSFTKFSRCKQTIITFFVSIKISMLFIKFRVKGDKTSRKKGREWDDQEWCLTKKIEIKEIF